MARNCAVIVGINDYDEISPLKYAKSDAERMRDFFMQDLGVSQDDLYFFTDDSPRNAQGRKTQPTYGTLKSFLGDRFENPFLSAGDTLWFYFSGHGMPCEGRDYLLPSDGNPRSMPALGIAISDVTERLRRSGADNVVMLIDACRSDGAKNVGMGIGEEKQQGVITFFSCSPSQVSYEIDEIGQGVFTNVLLEALRIQGEGNCATVERFANYLKARVPQLTKRYKSYVQTPYVEIKPETKLHYILLPKFANLTDISTLREDALHAEIEEDFALAFQLWMRVNVASGGTDMKAINALIRVGNKRSVPSPQPLAKVSPQASKSPAPPTISSPAVTKEFKREIIGRETHPVPEVKKNPAELSHTVRKIEEVLLVQSITAGGSSEIHNNTQNVKIHLADRDFYFFIALKDLGGNDIIEDVDIEAGKVYSVSLSVSLNSAEKPRLIQKPIKIKKKLDLCLVSNDFEILDSKIASFQISEFGDWIEEFQIRVREGSQGLGSLRLDFKEGQANFIPYASRLDLSVRSLTDSTTPPKTVN